MADLGRPFFRPRRQQVGDDRPGAGTGPWEKFPCAPADGGEGGAGGAPGNPRRAGVGDTAIGLPHEASQGVWPANEESNPGNNGKREIGEKIGAAPFSLLIGGTLKRHHFPYEPQNPPEEAVLRGPGPTLGQCRLGAGHGSQGGLGNDPTAAGEAEEEEKGDC